MGFDLHGLNPVNPHNVEKPIHNWHQEHTHKENEIYFEKLGAYEVAVVGAHWCTNNWRWRPLWAFVFQACVDFMNTKDLQEGMDNSGYKISKTKANKIAKRLNDLDKDGSIVQYQNEYTKRLATLPLEKCSFCKGTGIRLDPIGMELREKDPNFKCNICHGKGEVTNISTHYPFSYREVLSFKEFCENSGGFKIC